MADNDFSPGTLTQSGPSVAPSPYYIAALGIDMETIWGEHPIYGSAQQIGELCGYAMLTAFYDRAFADISARRDLLYWYIAYSGFSTTSADDILRLTRGSLPTDTFTPKVVNALALAYSRPPQRTWKDAKGEEHASSETMRRVYQSGGFDGRLQVAHRYATLTSGVLVRPYVGSRGRWQLEILTPDLCRWQTETQYPDALTEVAKPLIRYDAKGKPETVFEVWHADEYHYTDARGRGVAFTNEAGERIPAGVTIPNPYGRIPYTVMRLVEPNDNATFDAGMITVVEANLATNKLSWLAQTSAAYESWGHWFGVNTTIGKGRRPTLGFGRGTFLEDVPAPNVGNLAEPFLQNVSGNGQYGPMGDFQRSYAEDVMIAAGMTESDVRRNGGTPPSGVARLIERLGLIEHRRTDTLLLAPFERDLAELVATVYNADVSPSTGARMPDAGTAELSVEWAEESVIEDRSAVVETNTRLLLAGVMAPSRFLRETVGVDVATDEEAVAYIGENQRLTALVRDAMAGVAGVTIPAAPTVTVPEMPTATSGTAPDMAGQTPDAPVL